MHQRAFERDVSVLVSLAIPIDNGIPLVAVNFQLALVDLDKFLQQVEA